MNIINERQHAIIDYIISFLLIVIPYYVNFSLTSLHSWLLIVSGFILFTYTALTDFENSLIRKIKLKNHFRLDIILAIIIIFVEFITLDQITSKFFDIFVYSSAAILFLNSVISKII